MNAIGPEIVILPLLAIGDHRRADVKATDGQTYEIDMDAKTRVTRHKKTAALSELKAGRSVVVDALGHDMFDLVTVEVQLVK